MEWKVAYEPQTRTDPWSVYKTFDGKRIFERGFLTEDEARSWAHKKEKQHEAPQDEQEGPLIGTVDEASIESFPASDPPAWTNTTVNKTDVKGNS